MKKQSLSQRKKDDTENKKKETAKMTDTSWLVFFSQTPATPSSLRVLVWRRLQQAGALNLQGGAWMLPHVKEQVQVLQALLSEMEQQGGSGFYLEARAPSELIQTKLIERFQAERDSEYLEFGERCQQFLAEIEKETRAHKFTFAELEENEEDLLKLTRWLRKIQQRDFFSSSGAEFAVARLAHCRQTLQAFTLTVYEQEGLPAPNSGEGPQSGAHPEEGEEGVT